MRKVFLRLKLTLCRAYMERYRSHVTHLMTEHYQKTHSFMPELLRPPLARKYKKLNRLILHYSRLEGIYSQPRGGNTGRGV